MATTDVEVCNLALTRVRAGTILSLTENSAEADACRALYPELLDELLENHSWRFAQVSRALSLQAEEPVEWAYMFDYPNDSVQPRYLTFDGYDPQTMDAIPYEIILDSTGERRIVTDIDEPILVYTKRLTDVRQFSANFVQALSWRLAIDLAPIVGGESGSKYGQMAEKGFTRSWGIATAANSNASQPKNQRVPKAIAARNSSNRQKVYPDWRST